MIFEKNKSALTALVILFMTAIGIAYPSSGNVQGTNAKDIELFAPVIVCPDDQEFVTSLFFRITVGSGAVELI